MDISISLIKTYNVKLDDYVASYKDLKRKTSFYNLTQS